MNKLNATALGLAFGILWAAALFIVALLAAYANYATPFVELVGSLYLGVKPSLAGAFIALPWAFLDGFIGGWLLGWLYNKFA